MLFIFHLSKQTDDLVLVTADSLQAAADKVKYDVEFDKVWFVSEPQLTEHCDVDDVVTILRPYV